MSTNTIPALREMRSRVDAYGGDRVPKRHVAEWIDMIEQQVTERLQLAESEAPAPRSIEAEAPVIDAGGVVHCGSCGGTEFRYDESHPSTRTQAANSNRRVTFHGEFEWFDGDSEPGAVCQACERPMDRPHWHGVEIDFA